MDRRAATQLNLDVWSDNENMPVNKQLPAEAGTIVKITSQLEVYAPPDYARANVAGLLVGSAQTAVCHIPAYTSKFFDKQTSLPVGGMLLPDRSRSTMSKR